MENIWITILSSAGVASVIYTIAGYISTKRLQHKAFINEYYTMIINKRIEAYNIVNDVSNMLILVDVHKSHDGELLLCSDFVLNEELKAHRFQVLESAINNSMWLSKSVVECLSALNKHLFVQCKKAEVTKNKVGFAAECYDEIIEYANKLDALVANDLLTMYEVEEFLKSKKQKNK